MPLIRPCADLRNNYNEISRICHETKEPMYITKNGGNDLVILSDEAYENMIKTKQEIEDNKINQLVTQYFDMHYATLEEFKQDFLTKIYQALKDVDEGNYQTMKDFCAEMEETYELKLT